MVQTTQFNPFGESEEELRELRKELVNVAEHFRKEVGEYSGKPAGISNETRQVTVVLGKLGVIVKAVDESAVQSLLTELSAPLSLFLSTLCHNSEKIKQLDMTSLSRGFSRLLQIIADRVLEPFTSDLLEQWAPIFETLLTGKIMLLKEVGINLWKNTFAKVKGPLKYPGELRKTLEKMPKRNGLVLPPDEKALSRVASFEEDEEAMDGLEASSTTKVASDASQSTFDFSQQPAADELAEKLLSEQEQKKKADEKKSATSTATTPVRRRQSKIPSLLDEDSCDFVAITATPPSSRKSRLTDRQKEKLAEASAPSTTINYVNEESQSGFQKKEQLKAALSAMNYDVGEDSVSICAPASSKESEQAPEGSKTEDISDKEKTSEEVEEPPKRASRSRKSLFEVPTKKVVEKRCASAEGKDSAKTESAVFVVKKVGRPRRFPSQSNFESTPPKKRLRSSTNRKEESGSASVSDDVVMESPSPKKAHSDESEVQVATTKIPEDPKPSMPNKMDSSEGAPVDVSNTILTALESTQSTVEAEKTPEASDAEDSKKTPEVEDVEMKDAAEEQELSPPKTPSILRNGKRGTAGTPSILRRVDSPLTEKKKNRVHFGEESLPQDGPPTPRRGQVVLAVDVKSPTTFPRTPRLASSTATDDSESSKPSAASKPSTPPMGLLEIQDPTSSTSPFFRSLVGCNDPIERVVRNLAPMCVKTAVDAVKRSLTQAGVKTIGEFASLSKKQISELSGIKNPKEKCARSVLTEYEAKKRAETRASEERILAETSTDKMVDVEKIFEKAIKDEEEGKKKASPPPLKPLPMMIDSPAPVLKLPEVPANLFISSSQSSETSETSETSSDGFAKASQSPASTISSAEKVEKPATKGAREDVRKNLVPMFDKSMVKKEVESPPHQTVKEGKNVGNGIIEDSRLLHRVCNNLSYAHCLKQLPAEKWSSQLTTINKAAILFKNIVQERGSAIGEWDDVDSENDDVAEDLLAPEDDVKTLRAVYRRFSRHHALADVDDAAWRAVMETVNEAAVVLRSIVAERAAKV